MAAVVRAAPPATPPRPRWAASENRQNLLFGAKILLGADLQAIPAGALLRADVPLRAARYSGRTSRPMAAARIAAWDQSITAPRRDVSVGSKADKSDPR